jgi:predicted XRE-type DNA-binding protein
MLNKSARCMKGNGMTTRKRSPKVTREMAAKIKRYLLENIAQHDIAALFGINQGRISEIKTGKKFPDVPAAGV